MLLSFQSLEDVASVNQFRRVDAWRLNQGDTPALYFQLTDISKDASSEYKWPGMRYVPASGAYLTMLIHNINDDLKIYRVCTQPFPLQDPSIWLLQLLPTDTCLGTPDILLTLAEYSTPGITAVAGTISLFTSGGNIVTLAIVGGTFAAPPPVGGQVVIGVDSVLYAANNANGGFYQVTASSSTSITATKVSDLFYGGLTTPQSVGAPGPVINVVSTGDIRVGPAVSTHSALTHAKLRAQLMGQYAVPYNSPYSDINLDNQTGFGG